MLALGLDTSTSRASLALADGQQLRMEATVQVAASHSETLLPALRQLVDSSGRRLAEIGLIVVTTGPGSFTGLRIGLATARGLGMALSCPVTGFSTLETIAIAAAPAPQAGGRDVCVLLDAGRGEVYRGLYRCDGERAEPLLKEEAITPERAATEIPPGSLVCGDAAAPWHAGLAGGLPPSVTVLAAAPPVAGTLARRGLSLLSALAARGRDTGALPPALPNYLRVSDAERTFRG